MPLKNYTSQVPANRSIEYIERSLARNGARQVVKTFDGEGRVICIMFVLAFEGRELPFKLPSRIRECQQVLENDLSPRAKPETKKKIPAQAERTAWKIVSDWVEAQMAMIELAQVDALEVFLPYAYDPAADQTFYEATKERGFKALMGGAS